ncbi:hypothetical protein ROA7023_03798 [Roseisalinus antarcticus]|uniref:Uncharacterized protein n=2 Tax=Roseisalinus antarcticus TaxID=254357 RepID=A0A1Y5U1T3_9RHOB|nr:hypothetical protein [Roseisalinus antarcticus]SLN74413.1 hypothetical protein ROA7023_03798 [Roseisalinus antarcticus]
MSDRDVPIASVTTFNPAGISRDVGNLANPSLIGAVEHRVSAGDIVSLAGRTYLDGDVVIYDLDTIDLSSPWALWSHILTAHVDQWSREGLYDLTSGYSTPVAPTPRSGEPVVVAG